MSERRHTIAIALAVALGATGSLVGCGGGAGTGEGRETTPDSSAPDWLEDGSDPVAQRMNELARRMREAGLVVGGPSGRGFLTVREEHHEPIDIPSDTCVTIVAMTSRGIRDLDATVFSPSGDVLAEDVEPDAHPTIQACGGARGRRVYYSITSYEGAGTFVFASFRGNRDSFVVAQNLVGGQPGIVSDEEGDGAEDRALREFATGVARRGFRSDGPPMPVPLASGQRVRVPLRTERGRCYTVVAFGMGRDLDLDLVVLDELGQPVARAESREEEPSAQICAARDADFAVEVHAVRGAGEARVSFFSGPDARVGGASGLWLGEPEERARSAVELDEAVEGALDAARARGWEPPSVEPRATGTLVGGQAVEHGLRLTGGRCTLVLVVGGRGSGRFVLRVVGHDGRVWAEREGAAPAVDARICIDRPTDARVQVIARRGEGRYAVYALERPVPENLGAGVAVDDRGAVLDVLERGEARGLAVRTREEHDAPLEGAPFLGTAECATVAVVARGVTGRVDVTVRRGAHIAARSDGRSVELVACRREGAPEPKLHVTPQAGTPGYRLFVLDRR